MLPTNKRQASIVLGDEDILQSRPQIETTLKSPDVLPSDLKEMLTSIQTFSKSSSMKDIQVDLNAKKRVAKFEGQMEKILTNIKKLKLDEDNLKNLVLFVLQSAEDYIYDSDEEKSKRLKEDICVKLLRPFTNGDIKLVKQFISIVNDKVKKSTLFRRNKKRMMKLFFFVFKTLGVAM